MKNVQISFDEKLLKTIDHIAANSQFSRSAIVRKALKYWIREKEIKTFEEAWIDKLKENPEKLDNAENWLHKEQWSDL